MGIELKVVNYAKYASIGICAGSIILNYPIALYCSIPLFITTFSLSLLIKKEQKISEDYKKACSELEELIKKNQKRTDDNL